MLMTRRGWFLTVGALLALATVYYTTFLHQPFGRLSSTSSEHGGQFGRTVLAKVPTDGLEDVLGPLREYEDGFTIVSPTYHRTESLTEYLDNYATGLIPSLRKIILIWNNEDDAPAWLNASLIEYPVPVVLERRARNSKNERFRRTPAIANAAVLALDDDMVIAPQDVEDAFQAWRTYHQPRRRMVGFVRRSVDDEGRYSLRPQDKGYSMVLTKSAFVHVDWMDLWWEDSEMMAGLREYVDGRKLPEQFPDLTTGCEDIAMSYLYAHHSRTPPLWVAGAKIHDIGNTKKDGISMQRGHLEARSACVEHFNEMFGRDTLVDTRVHVTLIQEAEVGGEEA